MHYTYLFRNMAFLLLIFVITNSLASSIETGNAEDTNNDSDLQNVYDKLFNAYNKRAEPRLTDTDFLRAFIRINNGYGKRASAKTKSFMDALYGKRSDRSAILIDEYLE